MRPSWEHPHPGEMADSQPCFTSSQIPDKSWPLSWLQQDKDVPSALTEPPCQGRKMGQDSHLMRGALTPREMDITATHRTGLPAPWSRRREAKSFAPWEDPQLGNAPPGFW